MVPKKGLELSSFWQIFYASKIPLPTEYNKVAPVSTLLTKSTASVHCC